MSYEIPPPGGRPIQLAETRPPKNAAKPGIKDTARRRWTLLNGFVDSGMAVLKPSDVAVWTVLFRLARADGFVFASLKKLSELTGMDRRTVQRALGNLKVAGHIVTIQRGGGCAATRYRLTRSGNEEAVKCA